MHVGLQQTTPDELLPLYRHIEELGFDWISVWDHFYGATGKPDDTDCLEGVAMHAALACATSRVRCGSLVYSIGYRHPAVLAKAITTIDHLSGGRAEMGLGAGWAQVEYAAFGIPFPTAGSSTGSDGRGRPGPAQPVCTTRSRRSRAPTSGSTEARNDPRPVQAKLPIWIGGQGEKRTLRIAAQYADGWNAPFLAPEQFAAKRDVLHRHCADVGRDPGDIRCAINVGLAWTEESLRGQFGGMADFVRPGVLSGSVDEVVERVGRYVEAGADQVNLALRAPFDVEALEQFAAALLLDVSDQP